MPRTARQAPGGMVFHVLNRGVGRRTLFHKDEDFAAFERTLESTLRVIPIRVLAYCLMPNHWHLLLWPAAEGQLRRFMQRLTTAHVRRWQSHYQEIGHGHLYQGRFKSFPVQEDGHFLTVARYVERNPLRAKLVAGAQDWRWGSLWRRESRRGAAGLLSDWPVQRPADWLRYVNDPQSDFELAELRASVAKGCPFGSDDWQRDAACRLGLTSCFRDAGRPCRLPAASPMSSASSAAQS